MQRSTDLLQRLQAGLEGELPQAIELRRQLHAQPELGHAEHRTSQAVIEALALPVERSAGTGVIAQVGTGNGGIAIRAELDALPIDEKTGASFASTNGSMHACGHDIHMAALVALARAAASVSDLLPAPLIAVFQPSEETYPSGAQLLSESGSLSDASAVVAAHLHPELDWGTVALDAGPINASNDVAEITVTGRGTHSAYPHLGADPILALAQLIVSLHALVGRKIDPTSPAVITVSSLQAGTTDNVAAEVARARATLRALNASDRETLRQLVVDVVRSVSEAHGCQGEVSITAGEPALVNDPEIVAAARDLLAADGFIAAAPWRSCGSDDLAFLGRDTPLAMAFIGLRGAPSFSQRPLHHAEFLPPDDAVAATARVLAALYLGAASTHAR